MTVEQRERQRKSERDRYQGDPAFRERQLAARRARYTANIERERERSRRYYAVNRAKVRARQNARSAGGERR